MKKYFQLLRWEDGLSQETIMHDLFIYHLGRNIEIRGSIAIRQKGSDIGNVRNDGGINYNWTFQRATDRTHQTLFTKKVT